MVLYPHLHSRSTRCRPLFKVEIWLLASDWLKSHRAGYALYQSSKCFVEFANLLAPGDMVRAYQMIRREGH